MMTSKNDPVITSTRRVRLEELSLPTLIGNFATDMSPDGFRGEVRFQKSDAAHELVRRGRSELHEIVAHIEANMPTTNGPSGRCPGSWAYCYVLSHVGAVFGIKRPAVEAEPKLKEVWLPWAKDLVKLLAKKAKKPEAEATLVPAPAQIAT